MAQPLSHPIRRRLFNPLSHSLLPHSLKHNLGSIRPYSSSLNEANNNISPPSYQSKENTPPIRFYSSQTKKLNVRHVSPDNNSTPRTELSRTIFSGIQPTGIPHLGNYLGAISTWVELQNSAELDTRLLFSVVDLHALTTVGDRGELGRKTKECLASLVACGLGGNESEQKIRGKTGIFIQSRVPEHSELMWILSCTASMGYLGRMTQWKSKLQLDPTTLPLDETSKSKLKLGLFSYPVLQAADILVHRATHVPVGEDQSQHLEFARECVTNFNTTYGNGKDILVKPETILSPTKRIMSLTNPSQKMSKSDPSPSSRILITDSPTEIQSKLRTAVTDSINSVSWDPINRPGVSNLLSILSAFDPEKRTGEELGSSMGGIGLGAFKQHVGEVVSTKLDKVRMEFEKLMDDDGGKKGGYLKQVAVEGEKMAKASAEGTMKEVRRTMGLY